MSDYASIVINITGSFRADLAAFFQKGAWFAL